MSARMWLRRRGAFIAGSLMLMICAVEARAQGTSAATLAKVTVSADEAKKTLMKMQINAATARALVDACVEFARSTNASYSVFVVAPTGDIVDAHIMDGQLPIAVEAALLKAKTVLYARTSSRAITERFTTTDSRMIRLDLGQASGLAYYFAGGGLPIVVEDQLIGAIGVGGGAQEEMCAYQALTKVLGPQPPLAPARPPAATPAVAPVR